jgi:hypothetical protein
MKVACIYNLNSFVFSDSDYRDRSLGINKGV